MGHLGRLGDGVPPGSPRSAKSGKEESMDRKTIGPLMIGSIASIVLAVQDNKALNPEQG